MDLSKNINSLRADANTPISCDNKEFKKQIAHNLGLKRDNFLIYSCTDQALFALLHSLESNHLYIYAPSHLYYEQIATKTKKSIEYINRFVELESELLPNSIVIFSNPSFPDGNYYELDEFLEYWKSQNITVIIDESYLSFTKKQTLKKQIKNYENLFIIESLSPFYGIESLHLSLIHSKEDNLTQILNSTPSCHISSNEQNLLLSAFEDSSFKSVTSSVGLFNKELFINEFQKLPFVKDIYPSLTNYFLFRVEEKKIDLFKKFLETHKITITQCQNLQFLDKSFFALTIPKNKDVKKLLSLMETIKY